MYPFGVRNDRDTQREHKMNTVTTTTTNCDFLRLILHNADVYNEKHQRKKMFLIIFHGRYNEKKRLVALKRAQAHRGARASPGLLYHLSCCCCCCFIYFFPSHSVSYAIFIVVHKYICITHRFLHVSILFLCVFFSLHFLPLFRTLSVFVCKSSFYSIHFFFSSHFALLLLLCFSCAHPNVVSIIFNLSREREEKMWFILVSRWRYQRFSFERFLPLENNDISWTVLAAKPFSKLERYLRWLLSFERFGMQRNAMLSPESPPFVPYHTQKCPIRFLTLKIFRRISFAPVFHQTSKASFLHLVLAVFFPTHFRASVFEAGWIHTFAFLFSIVAYTLLSSLYAYIWMVTPSPSIWFNP